VALYIPPARRRRRLAAAAALALVVGLLAGLLIGRATVPSVDDRVRAVQADARATAAGLRVLALHDQAGATASRQPGDGGADLVLARTRTGLTRAFAQAPWLGATQRAPLLRGLDRLAAMPDRTSAAFGTAAETLAGDIDATFGRS